MWYRDYTLVQQRVRDVEREIRDAAVAAALAGAERPAVPPDASRRGLRTASAGAVRRLGRAVLAVSDWMDAGLAERTERCAPAATSLTYRHHS